MEDRNTFKREITNSSSIFNNISNIRKPIIEKKYLKKRWKNRCLNIFLKSIFYRQKIIHRSFSTGSLYKLSNSDELVEDFIQREISFYEETFNDDYLKLNFSETRSYSNETNYEIEKLKIELQKVQNQNIEALKRMNDFKKDLYTEREKNSISQNENVKQLEEMQKHYEVFDWMLKILHLF